MQMDGHRLVQVGQRNTATTCGMSGGSGASWWTRGGSVSVTSPQVNLVGHSGLSLQAWIKQGNYQCGEEPDSNENFYLEYKNSNNGWTQCNTCRAQLLAAQLPMLTTIFLRMHTTLNFQIRARQNAGSGTCCDYWFFDDIIIPGTSGANLTTRSFGWSSSSHEQIDEGRYSPVFIDAIIPQDAHLNWTVIDADTNIPIPGFTNRTGQWIDLAAVDWKKHKSLRLNLEFASNPLGDSPRLFGISGGGKYPDGFNSNPEEMGWELDNSSWSNSTFTISGNSNSIVESPELDINMPFSSYKFQSTQLGDVIALFPVDRGNWVQVNSSSQRIDLDKPASVIQVKYLGLVTVGPWMIFDYN